MCDVCILNDVFIEDVDLAICHSHRLYYVQNFQADLTDIAFRADSHLFIQKGANLSFIIDENTFNQRKRLTGNLGATPFQLVSWTQI